MSLALLQMSASKAWKLYQAVSLRETSDLSTILDTLASRAAMRCGPPEGPSLCALHVRFLLPPHHHRHTVNLARGLLMHTFNLPTLQVIHMHHLDPVSFSLPTSDRQTTREWILLTTLFLSLILAGEQDQLYLSLFRG
jgi:hypothetical protein